MYSYGHSLGEEGGFLEGVVGWVIGFLNGVLVVTSGRPRIHPARRLGACSCPGLTTET